MNILHFASSDGKFGSAKCLKELVYREKQYGHTPVVITPKENDINEFCNKNEIENHILDYQQFMIPKHDSWPIFIFKYLLRRIEYKIKIRRAVAAINDIVDMSKFDLIHTNVSVVSIGAILSKKYNKKHVWHIREFGKEDFCFYPVIRNYIEFMNTHCNLFIAISDAVRKKWIEKGIDPSKIVTCYDGVENINEFGAKTESDVHLDNGVMKIAMCGALSEAKGQTELVEAVSMLDDGIRSRISVDFYGSGTEKFTKLLIKKIHDNNLSNVQVIGYRNDLQHLLGSYDVGINCSVSEAFGRVTVEYMLARLYIIASDTGANPEILCDGRYGRLYAKNNIIQLAERIMAALMEYKTSSLGQMAYEYADWNFNIEKNVTKLMALFDKVCNT